MYGWRQSLFGLVQTWYGHSVSSWQRSVSVKLSFLASANPWPRLTVQAEFIELWESEGTTVIFVTHDLEEAVLLADRVIVITARPGRIKSDTIIDLPRPRIIDELRFDESFKEAEHRIWRELRDEIV